mgnify:CR=1 FL=1
MTAKKVVKKKSKAIEKQKENTVKIFNTEVPLIEYFEYYSLVIFFLFSILFVFVFILFFYLIFGPKYLWLTIPIILVFWGLSYYLSKIVFKKSRKKR